MKFIRILIIRRKKDLIRKGKFIFLFIKIILFFFRNGTLNEQVNKKQIDDKIIKLYKKNNDNLPVGDTNVINFLIFLLIDILYFIYFFLLDENKIRYEKY